MVMLESAPVFVKGMCDDLHSESKGYYLVVEAVIQVLRIKRWCWLQRFHFNLLWDAFRTIY